MNATCMPPPRSRWVSALCLLTAFVFLAGACNQRMPTKTDDRVSRLKKPDPCGPRDRPYRLATCAIQQDVRDVMARVPGATPMEWGKLARKLAAYGEPAVPQLVANLESSEPSVQLMSAYVLGVIKDPRALDALYLATFDPNKKKLRYEAATSMLRMGDRRGLMPMVDALEDVDPLIRARAILVLKERAGETFGYRADDHPHERAAAVARWRAWLQRSSGMAGG